MSLLEAFAFDPFNFDEPLLDSFLLEPDSFEVWIASRTDGQKGSGTEDDPYDGSSQSALDSLLGTFAPNTTVHLGPGNFQTQGFASGVIGGWQPKSGQRILGAGYEQTILKLVNASSSSGLTAAIGGPSTNFLVGFEVSDLAVDCNLAGQPIPIGQAFAPVACAAISVSGTHIYINRVRVINFGTQTASVKGGAILVGNVDPSTPPAFDCVIDSCIVEQPNPNNVRETTCLGIVAKEDGNGVMAYHRACVVRNCFVDCLYTGNPPSDYATNSIAISSITFSGTTATAKFTNGFSHGLSGSPWVVITGALENSLLSTNYNGSFQVTVTSTTEFTYTMPGTPWYQPTGDMYISRVPSQRVAIQSLTLTGSGPYTATLTTVTPHNRILGSNPNNILLNGVAVGGSYQNAYNGAFQITAILSPTQLQFSMATNPGTPTLTNAYIGADFRAIEADGGLGTIIEANRIYNCTFGYYHDGYSTKDLVIRNNFFKAVGAGIYQKMGATSAASNTPTSLTRNGALALFTTSQPHGFAVGSIVTVSGASPATYNGTFQVGSVPSPTAFGYAMATDPGSDASGSPVCNGLSAVSLVHVKTLATMATSNPHGLSFGQAVAVSGASPASYNGTFAVASVPDPNSFTYIMTSDPGSNASGTISCHSLWQVGRIIIEKNVIELILNVMASGWEAPVGINLYDVAGSHGAQYVYQQVVIRGNVICQVDNASDPSQIPLAIYLDSCLNATIENNHINLNTSIPLRHYAVGSVKYFNSQTPGGLLLQGASYTKSGAYGTLIYTSDTFNQFLNELGTVADLGLSLAI
jgi:hypothetical protein